MFSPSRLILARKRRGFSKKSLAQQIDVSARILIAYEQEDSIPSEETVQKIASALRFPVSFFYADEADVLTPPSVSFRAYSTLSASSRDIALSAGALAGDFNDWLSAKFNLPLPSIPDFRAEHPEAAAEAVRAEWGLGNSPVSNMLHLLESKGVRIFTLPEEALKVDAFCFWRKETPFVFLNMQTSAERSRFDLAHELGHLVLHRHGKNQGPEAEVEADIFASAFLMPKSSVIASRPAFVNLENLIKLKKKWIVSIAALNYRFHSLSLTSEWQYRMLCVSISERGFRKSEPNGASHESSQLLSKVFNSLRADGVSKSQIARELNICVDELESLLYGLVITGLQSNKAVQSSAPKGGLRLV